MPEVTDVPERNRYEITADGEVAGYAQYVRRGNRVIFVHTEIDTRFEGQGLAATLVSAALDDVRTKGDRVVPLCPYVTRYIERHPEYADLIDRQALAALSPEGS